LPAYIRFHKDTMGVNQSRPECTVDQCLNQVIGNPNVNGPSQFEACVSTFGLTRDAVTV